MQRLEVSGAVRPIYGSLGVKRLIAKKKPHNNVEVDKTKINSKSNRLTKNLIVNNAWRQGNLWPKPFFTWQLIPTLYNLIKI